MSAGRAVRVDLRAALPVVALAIVVLAIIVVELCGRDDVQGPSAQPTAGPTAQAGPPVHARAIADARRGDRDADGRGADRRPGPARRRAHAGPNGGPAGAGAVPQR